jgi:hypothetical protein
LHSRQPQKGILHKPKTIVVGMGTKLKQKHNGKSTGVQSASAPLNTRRKKDKKKGGAFRLPPFI